MLVIYMQAASDRFRFRKRELFFFWPWFTSNGGVSSSSWDEMLIVNLAGVYYNPRVSPSVRSKLAKMLITFETHGIF